MKNNYFVLGWNGGGNRKWSLDRDRLQYAAHVGGQLQWTPFLKSPPHIPHAVTAERFTHAEAVALGERLTGQRNLMIGEV